MSSGGVETVTILVTDLVGSTQLQARVGAVVAEELREEHFRLLRDAVREAGGREAKNTGDGLMGAFERAPAAVSCAVSIQQRFERRNRSAAEALLIKVGVSAGDVSTAEGDVFGMPAVEAVRLCERCLAGRILAKELIAHLSPGRGHTFVSVGALGLKGLPELLSAAEVQWEPEPASAIALPERLRELPTTTYVGRVAERERLAEVWAQARDASLRLALIGGEAGVGKTRLSAHLALQLQRNGATVLYGRSDEDLGVPYQPWVQALGHLVNEAPQQVLDAQVERFGGDLARLVPALRDRVPGLPSPRDSDPETERYLLYAAVAGLLERVGAEGPLLLILDDLHWADQPTLSLLRHIVTQGSSMRAMVIGAYRDSELSLDHPLLALLADLHREQGVERIKLVGLEAADVGALMEAAAGHELDENSRELARQITRETAGNPFFAGELLRHLAESGAIVQGEGRRWHVAEDLADLGLPQSVREVIGRRVGRLGSDTRTALTVAAVIGRDFDLDLLLAVLDLPQARLLDLLDKAVTASLLRESRARAGHFTFTHALVEHTLYEDLGSTRRAVLHKRIAQALERLCGEDPGERLGELAGHWAAAVVSADPGKAIHYAQRAAEHALQQLAPDEAMRWYRKALELKAQAHDGDRLEHYELLIGLGQAQRQAGDFAFRQTLLDATHLAQDLGDTDRLARAVLANTRGFSSRIGGVDGEKVQALQAASQALPGNDPRRGQVLALLASELHWAGEPSRCRRLAAEGIEVARAAGGPAALAHALVDATWAVWAPDTFEERKELTRQLVELAHQVDDPWLRFLAAFRPCGLGIEAGDRALTESSLSVLRGLADSVPQPLIRRVRLIFESVWALVHGDLHASEQWATQALEVGTAVGEPDAPILFGTQIVAIRTLQGRLGELAEQVVQRSGELDSIDAWRATAAQAVIQAGREDEARDLALAEDFQRLPSDQAWSGAMIGWADVCCRLHLQERSAELHELLAPFAGQLAAPPGSVYGTFAWMLGRLATTLGRHEEAEERFAAAAEIEQAFGAPLLLARTRASWARALIARGRPEDLDRARPMLEQADEAAARLGAGAITREAEQCRAALAAMTA